MSAAVNQVLIVGRLGRDPDLREAPDRKSSVRLRVATNRVWRDGDGTRHEETEWHTVRVYGPQAETCHRYLRTGRLVGVEGRLHHYSWETDAKETRWSTEIVARQVHFLDGSQSERGEPDGGPTPGGAGSSIRQGA